MIIGDKIRLRGIEKTDLPLFVRWMGDREVTRSLIMRWPVSLAAEEKWFERVMSHPSETRPMAIEVETSTGWQTIGTCGFHEIDWENRSAEFGIMIGEKSFWGQGWGRKAVRLLLSFGFEDLNLHRVYLYVFSTNERAVRAYRAAGFTMEGCLRQDIFQDGRYVDAYVMGILRSEWRKEEEPC